MALAFVGVLALAFSTLAGTARASYTDDVAEPGTAGGVLTVTDDAVVMDDGTTITTYSTCRELQSAFLSLMGTALDAERDGDLVTYEKYSAAAGKIGDWAKDKKCSWVYAK